MINDCRRMEVCIIGSDVDAYAFVVLTSAGVM